MSENCCTQVFIKDTEEEKEKCQGKSGQDVVITSVNNH